MKNRNIKLSIFSLVVALALCVSVFCGLSSMAFASSPKTDIIPSATGKITTKSSGKIYYVSADAAYDSCGEANNREKPANISMLLGSRDILQPGDTVKIIPGNYDLINCITMTVSGTFDSYITIENESATEQATLSFYRQSFGSTERGVEIEGNYIYWRDVDICGAGDNGLYIGGSYNIIEDCEFYDNRDTGCQLGRSNGNLNSIEDWPSYNLIKNCTSHNNYDNETYGENADGFAAKLTVGYGNVFDGCIAYRNSDDGWDLYAKTDSGNIGAVIIYNCVAFENGFIEYNQQTCNAKFPKYRPMYNEAVTTNFDTRDGDGNGFKLGGSVMEGDVVLYNCLAFHNKMHGVTDNSNPGVLCIDGVTSYDNARAVDNNVESPTYGQVTAKGGESCGDIDVSRQTFSYNNLKHVLSIKGSEIDSLDNDLYRASVQDSILGTASGSNIAYKIVGTLDADSKNGIKGTEITAPNASQVFDTLPIIHSTQTYNLSGLKDMDNGTNRVHIKYRNADGSINMHGILAVKDYSLLLGENCKIGSILNLESYQAYKHFDLTNDYSGVTSQTDAVLKAAREALTISCNPEAVFQDFWVPTNMTGVTIEWKSSNEEIVQVSDTTKKATSSASFVLLVVTRDFSAPQDVTITATIKSGGSSVQKSFALNIMQGHPSLGEIYVKTSNGEIVRDGGSFIVDQYTVSTEPLVYVENGSDYGGKVLAEGTTAQGGQYTLERTYEYATSKISNFVTVKEYTPSNAGVWRITYKATLNSSEESKIFRYTIYTASTSALVDFVGDPTLTVNLNGYLLGGSVSNVTGTVYAISSAKYVDVTPTNIKTLEGVQTYNFNSDNIVCQFTNDNNAGYYVFFAIANMRGVITSDIYQMQVSAFEISTTEDFMTVAGGGIIEDENPSETIYMLTKCLDFSNVNYVVGEKNFRGMLNGNGHTVSNISISRDKDRAGVFYGVAGGTIANIKFDNITVNNGAMKIAGIVAACFGGYFHNIAVTNISVTTSQRAGGLIGQIYQGETPTHISSVSVINPLPELNSDGTAKLGEDEKIYQIKSNGNRAGGIVGLIQPSNASITDDVLVYISDCYTQTYTVALSYSVGGIVAEYDDGNAANIDPDFRLEIYNCYTSSVLVGMGTSSRIGGMLGYQHGSGVLRVGGCFSQAQMYFKNSRVDVAQKNISGIIGNFASYDAAVYACGAAFEEYNSDYGVNVYDKATLESETGIAIFENVMGFNPEIWTFIYQEGSKTQLSAPYLSLDFDDCDC